MSSSPRNDAHPTESEAWLWGKTPDKKNFIFGAPCTGRMVKLCVDRWLSAKAGATAGMEGWVLLTTEARSEYWRSLLTNAATSFPVPQPHFLTFATIGTLKAFCDSNLADKRLLVVDHAELLLKAHRYALPLIRQFGGRMLFTQHVDLAGLCDLLEFVVDETDLKDTLPGIRERVSLPPSLSVSQPQAWHSNVVTPATTWLWHFVVVLFMYANASRLSSWWSSVKSALSSVTARKAQGMEGGGVAATGSASRKRTAVSRIRATQSKSRHTVRAQGSKHARRRGSGLHRMSRRLPRAGGGLTQWFVEFSSETLVNMIVQVIQGLFNKSCELIKETGRNAHKLVFSNMRGKQRKFVRALSKVTIGMARQAKGVARSTPRLRSSFKDLNQSVQTLFQTDRETASMAITCTFIWACMWMATYLLKRCLGTRPKLKPEDSCFIRAHTVFAKRDATVQHGDCSAHTTKVAGDIASHRMHQVRVGCDVKAAEAFVPGMLAIATKHRKTAGNRSVALQELSERTVTSEHIQACFQKSIKTGRRHLYAFQRKALYKKARVLVVVPDSVSDTCATDIAELENLDLDDWNTLETAASSDKTSGSHTTSRVYRCVSINGLASHLAKRAKNEKPLPDFAAAHEIHFVVPPSHAEYQFVWGLFGTNDLGEERHLLHYKIGNFQVEYCSNNALGDADKGTLVFEHVRTYHHLMSTTPINPGAMFAQVNQAVRQQALVTKTPDELFVELREGTHVRWQGVVHEYGKDNANVKLTESKPELNPTLNNSTRNRLAIFHKTCTKTLNSYLHQPSKAERLSLETQLGFAQETVIRLTEELKYKQQNARWNGPHGGLTVSADTQKARQLEQLLGHLRGFAPLQQAPPPQHTRRRSH